MNRSDIAVNDRLAVKRYERFQLKKSMLELYCEVEALQNQYHIIDTQYKMLLSVENMMEYVESACGGKCEGNEGTVLNRIMTVTTERYGEALDFDKDAFVSLENFRENVKRKWKAIVEAIVESISRFKKIILIMLGAIPRMRDRAEEVIATARGLNDTAGDVYLGADQQWLANKKRNNAMDPTANCEILIKSLEDFLIEDHEATKQSGIATVGALQDTKRVFDKRADIGEVGSADNNRAIQHIKTLLTASSLFARVSDQHPPDGAWRKAVNVPGVSSESTMTFMADSRPLPGSRYILYRFPRFSSAQPDLLYAKTHNSVESICEAAVQRFSRARVGLVALKPGKFDEMAPTDALKPNDIEQTARLIIRLCDLLERHQEQSDDMERIKKRLIRVGNTAMGAVSDGNSQPHNKASYMLREMIKYHSDRLERPYAALINLAVRTIEASLSYCEKSVHFGTN